MLKENERSVQMPSQLDNSLADISTIPMSMHYGWLEADAAFLYNIS